MPLSSSHPGHLCVAARLAGVALLGMLLGTSAGCQFITFKRPSIPLALWPSKKPADEQRVPAYAPLPPEVEREYDEAQALFDSGEYAAAEKAFKSIADRYKLSSFGGFRLKKRPKNAWAPDSKYESRQIVEDALFMLAESQFQQEKYARAQDTYDVLVTEFPSTRYLPDYGQRLFAIARNWLEVPDTVTTSDVQLADFDADNPRRTMTLKQSPQANWDPSRRIPILPNLWDRSRPLFDTDGRALEALRDIWMHDPNGPLADDALMLTASYHLRKENYLDADHHFQLLREQYPRSPHLENSFLLGSHVKLMTYQGSAYDGKQLEEARDLKERTLRIFPGNDAREQIRDELRRIEEAKAAQDWEIVIYYYRKRNPEAMKIYCRQVIARFPQTGYAALARAALAELEAGNMINPNGIRIREPAEAPTVPEDESPPLRRAPFARLLPIPFLNRDADEDETGEPEETPPAGEFQMPKTQPPTRPPTQSATQPPGRVRLGN